MKFRLVLVRHGLSSFNEKGLIQGRTDDSFLTDTGYKQAAITGKILNEIKFDKIFSSPLIRAAETARTIEKNLERNFDILFDNNLIEVNLDPWTGFTIDEIKKKYSESYLKWKDDPENLSIKNNDNNYYQPIQDLFLQAKNFLDENLLFDKNSKQKTVLIIAHNAILRCLILHLINRPKKGFRKIKLDNASISVLNVDINKNSSFKTQIECLNQTSHLNQNVPKQIGDSRIFLVRHGETDWNKEGRFQGQIDIPLNEKGKDQAYKASKYLNKVKFDKAYSSSMRRPYQTAQIILENKDILEIKKVDDLMEINHGLWEGKLEIEIGKDWPQMLREWHQKPENVKMPEGESIQNVSERSIKAWQKICKSQKPNNNTLIVAHDAVNKTLICNILGLDYSNIWMIKQGNGGISIIDVFEDPTKDNVLSALNITTHLGNILDSTASGAL